MALEAILFDLDGTLHDSAATIGAVLNGMRVERAATPLPHSHYRTSVSLGAHELIVRTFDVDGHAVPPLLDEFRARYRVLPTPPEIVFDGVDVALAALREAGLRLAICSNKPQALCEKVLQETGLRDYFHCVVGGDSAPHAKPHRAPLDLALDMLGVSAGSALLVGDSTVDQRAARNAGLPFVFFRAGYDDGVTLAADEWSIDTIVDLLLLPMVRQALRG